MNMIDTKKIKDRNTTEDFTEAKKCSHFLYDENGGPATWHCCFCDAVPRQRGIPAYCNLVWHEKCILGVTDDATING